MGADDILRRLNFGVKKTAKTRKNDGVRAENEHSLRLRVVPEDIKQMLRDSQATKGTVEDEKAAHESDGGEEGVEILAGTNLVVDDGQKKKKKKRKSTNGTNNQRTETIARLRRLNRMFSWGENIPEPIIDWSDLDLPEKLKANLAEAGINEPTPIQMQVRDNMLLRGMNKKGIPIMRERRNILASAPTGSGKTLAFGLPVILDVLAAKERRRETTHSAPTVTKKKKKSVVLKEAAEKQTPEGVLAVLLEPTRELALQTYRQLVKFSWGLDVSVAYLDEKELSGPVDIIVCTPNRLLHRLDSLSVTSVRWLVVDESDRLFDAVEGDDRCFRNQLGAIYKACDGPDVRRAFFSATFSFEVEEWCKGNVENVAMLCIGERNSANSSVEQELVFAGSEAGKVIALRTLLSTQFAPPAIVFVQSKERARQLMSVIASTGTPVPAALISSERTQQQRDASLESFRAGKTWVLVCTEVLARGLDLPAVNLVINFDLPTSIVSYIHRVGRAGRQGRAITYFTESDMSMVRPVAVVISQSGFPVPPYTLTLNKPSKEEKKKAMKRAPKRKDIAVVEKKRKVFRKGGKEAGNKPARVVGKGTGDKPAKVAGKEVITGRITKGTKKAKKVKAPEVS